MRLLISATLVTCLGATAAYAASFAPDLDVVCAPSPVPAAARASVDRKKLIGALLKEQAISDLDLDPSGNDLTFETKLNAVLGGAAFCSGPKRCSEGTAGKLNLANEKLVSFLRDNSRAVGPGQSGFEVSPPVSRSRDLAQVRETARLVDDFLHGKGGLRVACIAGPVAPADEAHVQAKKVLSAIAVRKSIDDLAAKPGSDSFRSAGRASVSYTDDGIKGTRTLASEAIVGYRLPDSLLRAGSSATLFATYYGNRVWAIDPKDEENVGNVGTGILGNFGFPVLDTAQSVQIFGHYIHSHVTNSDLLSAKLTMSPNLPLPGLGATFRPGNAGPLEFAWEPQLKLVYGSVLNAGSNPLLIDTHDYARGGGKISFWIFGVDGIFKNFTFNTSYENLKVWRGPLDTVSRFESALSYTLGDQDNWAIELKYVNGRNVDTLEREQIVKIGLGYKQ